MFDYDNFFDSLEIFNAARLLKKYCEKTYPHCTECLFYRTMNECTLTDDIIPAKWNMPERKSERD